MNTYDPDLVFITETWLSSKFSNSEIIGNLGYKIFHFDRKGRRGGGVCCLARASILLTPVASPSGLKSDLLCLELVDQDNFSSLRLILHYRPPSSSSSDDESLFDCLLDLSVASSQLIIVGDLNLDIDWLLVEAKNSPAAKFLELFNCLGLSQLVPKPTPGNSILDIVVCSSSIIRNISVEPPFGVSDHNSVTFELQLVVRKPVEIPLPDFMKADYCSLSAFLDSVDW